MISDDLFVKSLSINMILKYLSNDCDTKEKFIVEKLYSNEINYEKYNKVKGLFEKGKMEYKSPIGDEVYKDYVKKMGLSEKEISKEQQNIEPGAGQIWSTKPIPKSGNFEIEPVANPKYVYILSNPQAYQLLDNQDYIKDYKEYFTMLVLPISLEVNFATHKDYLISKGNDILGIEFMIESWLETNMIVGNLGKYIGELKDGQIEELLNIYFAANSMDYDNIIYEKANKGIFHNKDYGDIYEFQSIEEENIEYLYEPVNKLYDFLFVEYNEQINRIIESINEPIDALAAGDEKVLSPAQQTVQEEYLLFNDNSFEFKLVVLENKQLYIRLKPIGKQQEGNTIRFIIKDKISAEELQIIEENNLKRIHYFHVEKLLKNRLIEFSFFINDNLYFIKNVDFRDNDESRKN